MLKFDMHTHSRNSHDSKSVIADVAKEAIKNGIEAFAVTDHCDIEYYVEHDISNRINSSVKEATETKKEFEGKVKILRGVEIGEGIWNMDYTKELLNANEYDMVIGSVHAVRYKDKTEPYSTIDFSKLSKETIYEFLNCYFDDLLETLKSYSFDVMAHLTCPLRYINGKYKLSVDSMRFEEKIVKILDYIIQNDIAMEINTSGVDAFGMLMPDEWIIRHFYDMGGRLITLGSDAHTPENIGSSFDEAVGFLREIGFENYYYFENRMAIEVSLKEESI